MTKSDLIKKILNRPNLSVESKKSLSEVLFHLELKDLEFILDLANKQPEILFKLSDFTERKKQTISTKNKDEFEKIVREEINFMDSIS
jgi:hypothetical protein